jgi:hypothetical protein
MVRLMAAMSAFMEPGTESDKTWAEHCLPDMEAFPDEIEQGP